VVDFGITITSIERLYQEGPWHEVVILNEYDHIIHQSPYYVQQQVVRGLWQLRDRKVSAFSATSSIPYERLVNNCITSATSLKFKSEYELVHGTSPVTDPTIIPCSD
jgi:hypothetical protein